MDTEYLFVFDVDETLITCRPEFLRLTPGQPVRIAIQYYDGLYVHTQCKKHPQFQVIENLMRRALSNGHVICILTSGYFYTKDSLGAIFSPDVLPQISFSNGKDMANFLGLPCPRNIDDVRVNREAYSRMGRCKGDFIKRKIKPYQRTYRFVCALYDDSVEQCLNFNRNTSDEIVMKSALVEDFSLQDWSRLPTQFARDLDTIESYAPSPLPLPAQALTPPLPQPL